jgi:membrane protease YdiL (CAAX protease family)
MTHTAVLCRGLTGTATPRGLGDASQTIGKTTAVAGAENTIDRQQTLKETAEGGGLEGKAHQRREETEREKRMPESDDTRVQLEWDTRDAPVFPFGLPPTRFPAPKPFETVLATAVVAMVILPTGALLVAPVAYLTPCWGVLTMVYDSVALTVGLDAYCALLSGSVHPGPALLAAWLCVRRATHHLGRERWFDVAWPGVERGPRWWWLAGIGSVLTLGGLATGLSAAGLDIHRHTHALVTVVAASSELGAAGGTALAAWLVMYKCCVGPVWEEFLFRGYLLPMLVVGRCTLHASLVPP